MAAHIHRRGLLTPIHGVRVKLTSSVPTNDIEVGDLVGQESDYAVPAHLFTWDTNEATTRVAFAAAFLGVSADRSRAATTDARDLEIQVNTDGYYELEVVSGTYELGAKIGPEKAAGNALLQKCKAVSAENEAVAVCVERGTTVTRLLCALVNTVTKRISI